MKEGILAVWWPDRESPTLCAIYHDHCLECMSLILACFSDLGCTPSWLWWSIPMTWVGPNDMDWGNDSDLFREWLVSSV